MAFYCEKDGADFSNISKHVCNEEVIVFSGVTAG